MLKAALVCAALNMDTAVPATEPIWIPHTPTQEELNWVGRQYPAYGSLQRQEGEVLGLYVPFPWGPTIWAPRRFDYLAHESCHFIQHMEFRRFDEAECYRVQEKCK